MSRTTMLQQHLSNRCCRPQLPTRSVFRSSSSTVPVRSFHSLPDLKFSCNAVRGDVRVRVFNFKFGTKPQKAGPSREFRSDFTTEDVEDYFNYMGMLAVEGTYDKMYAMLNSGLDAPEILLLWACAENDLPKVEELLSAGALVDCKNLEGKRPEELATKPDILSLLQEFATKQRASVST